MVRLKFDAKQDRFKSGEEEESIRRLRLLEETTILKLFSKMNQKTFFLLRLRMK